jgi:hypothetical protein
VWALSFVQGAFIRAKNSNRSIHTRAEERSGVPDSTGTGEGLACTSWSKFPRCRPINLCESGTGRALSEQPRDCWARRRFVDARGCPTTVSTEEARLLASLRRLDEHTYTAVARWAQHDDGAEAAALPPGRRTHEEEALRRSIAALDHQLAQLQVGVPLSPPSHSCRWVSLFHPLRTAAGGCPSFTPLPVDAAKANTTSTTTKRLNSTSARV